MKNKGSNEAVSDIVGTVLLLGMTVALFSVLCVGVLSYPSSSCEPAVNLVGTIIETPDGKVYLLLEHRGGESLNLDTKVIITIEGTTLPSIIVGDVLSDDAPNNNLWNIGEGFGYQLVDYGGEQVKFTVIDAESNSVILLGSLNGT